MANDFLKRAARRNTGWSASGDQLRGGRRLGAELNSAFRGLRQKLSLLFGRGQGGISGRLLTFGDILLEASATRLGRIATAGIALLVAWLIIGR